MSFAVLLVLAALGGLAILVCLVIGIGWLILNRKSGSAKHGCREHDDIIVIRHDLSREVIATGLTFKQATDIESDLITDETVLNFVRKEEFVLVWVEIFRNEAGGND